MSDTPRCEPPEGWRTMDGWHWLLWNDRPDAWEWLAGTDTWLRGGLAMSGRVMWLSGRRYIAPITPAAEVEALRADNQRLRTALQKLYRGYVSTLENGRDRITSLGGSCDPVDVMENSDPCLIAARAALTQETPDV